MSQTIQKPLPNISKQHKKVGYSKPLKISFDFQTVPLPFIVINYLESQSSVLDAIPKMNHEFLLFRGF